MAKNSSELPDGASNLIALLRIAHREGDRQVERAIREKLARDYGLSVRFTCIESIKQELMHLERGSVK